ncbi:MAG: hypothetical protein J6P98_02985, partial [Clostridia bacterium]|nr:hypothetical protein [Clostridia bacterium]
PPRGQVTPPPSKSEAIRAMLLLKLSGEEPSLALNGFEPPFSDDIENALAAARSLKAAYVGQSAALLRFLIPIQAALFGRVSLRAGAGLLERGLMEAEDLLGVSLSPLPGTTAVYKRARLRGNRFELDCSRSSQFLSGLMIALPLQKRKCEIVIKNGLVSGPYADMTYELVRAFNGDIERTDTGFITRPSRCIRPERIPVFPDRSYAAVFEAMNLFGGEVTVMGERDPMQPDQRFLMISALPEKDVTDCPDLMPLLAVTACGTAGDTVIHGTARLSNKESDRPKTVEKLIHSLGGRCEAKENSLVIHGSGYLKGGRCQAFGDHRIAFAAAVAALISSEPVIIEGAECVSKSAPQFWKELSSITEGRAVSETEV